MDLQLEALTEGLEQHFRRIERTRMAGLPILNPVLRVQAVGLRRIDDGCLGALITPWFISLVLLPCEGGDWQDLPVGSRLSRRFPSGAYDFLVADEPPIGRYQTCSLLSPVLELADQETAVAFAEAALRLIQDPGQRDLASDTRAAEIERRWRDGNDVGANDRAGDEPLAPEPIDQAPLAERPISRRDLLFGRFTGKAQVEDKPE